MKAMTLKIHPELPVPDLFGPEWTALRKSCAKKVGNWRLIERTTNSGKSLFQCSNCLRISPLPDKGCYPLLGDNREFRTIKQDFEGLKTNLETS